MIRVNFLTENRPLPKPADRSRAERELSKWQNSAEKRLTTDPKLAAFMQELANDKEGKIFLESVFGNSPFLSQSMLHDPALLKVIFDKGFQYSFDSLTSDLLESSLWKRKQSEIMKGLRLAKRGASLIIALADICSAWTLDKICQSLSRFADIAISITLNFVLRQASFNKDILLHNEEDPQLECGIFILGLGKLGAYELNYSSDIDLFILFDNKLFNYIGHENSQQALNRITRQLVTILSERNAEGYVFRTDMRLRPDPSSTPLAVSTVAAEQYYESLGQNWERAAMIKARVVSGDQKLGEQFLLRLAPFVWRKYLDFAAIEDIHSIKRQINAHRGYHEIAVAGHDIKVGRGGIREIEFYAQTQQLIWGGKDTSLRAKGTCDALQALVDAQHAKPKVVQELLTAYHFLRKLEHRLQMIDDQQTHLIPYENNELKNVSFFMNYNTIEDLSNEVKLHLSCVESHYANLFENSPELGGLGGNLVFTGTEDDIDTLLTLQNLGFNDGKSISTTIRGWHHGRIKATRSSRARELLTELMPGLLSALSQTVNPDSAFMRFNEFLTNLPSGVQLFSMFHARPGLLDLLAEVMGSAPSLAKHLSRNANLLDGVLTGQFYQPLGTKRELKASLNDSLSSQQDFQDILDAARRWTHDREFQIGIQLLRGIISGERAGKALSAVAESTVNILLKYVEKEFQKVHGIIEASQFVVLAMGKLGGKEMTFSSDLDVIFIYRSKMPRDTLSNGERRLSLSHYFGRLSQRLVTSLNALTPAGKLYEVDARLRPAGSGSPLASDVEGFSNYQVNAAWTWEHMALTRARVIAGNAKLANDVKKIILSVLVKARNSEKLRSDVINMRNRIENERGTQNPWMLKHVRGGMLDLEFIAQYFQLRYAAKHHKLITPDTALVFKRLGELNLLEKDLAKNLVEATKLMKRLQALLRLTVGVNRNEDNFSAGVRNKLTQAANKDSFNETKLLLIETQHNVLTYYLNLIENTLPSDRLG